MASQGSLAMQRIISRLAGPETGVRLHSLSTATIRSVAMGVIGVAFIQALLLGVGFIWAGIPGRRCIGAGGLAVRHCAIACRDHYAARDRLPLVDR